MWGQAPSPVQQSKAPLQQSQIRHGRPSIPYSTGGLYRSQNSAQSSGLRKASVPPERVVENAAARLPKFKHVSRSAPRTNSCKNPALNVSPAPSGSTTSTASGEQWNLS